MTSRIERALSSITETLDVLSRGRFFVQRRNPLVYVGIAAVGITAGVGLTLLLVPRAGNELRSSITRAIASARGRWQSVVVEPIEAVANDTASSPRKPLSPTDDGPGKSRTQHSSHT